MNSVPNNSSCTESKFERISAVLDALRSEESQAEAMVHRHFVDRLVGVAANRINNRFRAKIAPEEVVQSVFASFFRRQRGNEFEFENWNDLWALLLTITTRKCADRIAAFQTQKRDVSKEITPSDSILEPTGLIQAAGPTAEEITVFEEILDQLFDRLNEPQQRIVSLRLQGMSNLEVSETINRTERTVYRMLNQIKQVFKELGQESESEL